MGGETQTADGLVDRVRAVTPLIAATAAEAEAQRRPLDHVIEALEATGVFRSFVRRLAERAASATFQGGPS